MKKRVCISIITCILAVIVGLIICFCTKKIPFELKNNKTEIVEYGNSYTYSVSSLIDTSDLKEKEIDILKEKVKIQTDLKNEDGKDYPAIGTYEIKLFYDDQVLTKKIVIKDTTAPIIKTDYKEVDIMEDTDLSTCNFKQYFVVEDLSPASLEINTDSVDVSTVGSYIITAKAIDSSNNENSLELKINVTEKSTDNQELKTETVVNDDGTKSVKNTLVEKPQEKPKKENTSNESSKKLVAEELPKKKKNSSNPQEESSQTQEEPAQPQESFVANMSIGHQTTQAIVVIGKGGSNATLTLHQKENGVWKQILSCSAKVGGNGITSNKREGDKKTPAGIYSFGQAFGVASNPGTSRKWLQVNDNHYWVDDSNSQYYNQLVDASQTGITWSSAEHLVDYAVAYKYAIAINYNSSCTPGAGSAIFLHCSKGRSTAGCISVSESNMIQILQRLQGDALIGIYENESSKY